MKKTGKEKHLQDKLTEARQENNNLVNMINNLEVEILDLKTENIRLKEDNAKKTLYATASEEFPELTLEQIESVMRMEQRQKDMEKAINMMMGVSSKYF